MALQFFLKKMQILTPWCSGYHYCTTSTELELRFCAGSYPARGVSEIRDGEGLWQWSWLEIMLNVCHRSTTSQKQFIIIITEKVLLSKKLRLAN